MIVRLVCILGPYKLNNIIFANFKSRKSFLSFRTWVFRTGTSIIYCSKLLIKEILKLLFKTNSI